MTKEPTLEESVDLFLVKFKDSHPEIFADPKVLEGVKAVVQEAASKTADVVRMFTTNKIAASLEEYALFDIENFKRHPVTEEEKEGFNSNPNVFMHSAITSIWTAALDLIEGVGYNGLNVKKLIETAKALEGDDPFDDVKFTSKQVGRA